MWARLSSRRSGQPFAITANPRVVFESTAFRSAFLSLTDAIAMRAGLILLVGDPGCGKTLLLRTLRGAHMRGSRPTFLRHATATGDLIVALLTELRLAAVPADRKGRLQALAECLAQRPGPASLLVDEGDELSHHQLAELAALAAWRSGEPDNLQIVVAGRPELKDRIEKRPLGAAQQPPVTICLGPLLRQELSPYVAHQLAIGRSRASFGSTALDRLYMHSHGIPLKINLLCTCALSRKTRRIEAVDVDAAAQFCGLMPAPSSGAVDAAGPVRARSASVMRRTGGRMLRSGYRAAAVAGLGGLAFAIIHLLQSVGDVARRDGDDRPAVGPQLQAAGTGRAELAPRDYIAAAVKTLSEPGTLLAPAILARPLAPRGTELAQAATERAPAAEPEPPPDNADESLPEGVAAEHEAEETLDPSLTALDEDPAPEAEASAPPPSIADTAASPDDPPEPVITHFWPGGDIDTPAGAAEPVAQAPIEAPAAAPAAAPARDPLSGTIGPSPTAPPPARAETLDMERLMQRGHALLQEGDVAAARLFFERAAASGHAAALTALGQSFDPLELQRLGVIGIKGDPVRALEWYRAANDAGDPAARERRARLSAWVERSQSGAR